MFRWLENKKVELGSAFFVWLYALLVVMSLLLGLFWQSFHLPATSPQGFPIHFYQHVLGHLDGRSCPAYPVCSSYAKQAFNKHGALLGSWLMIDRLIHEVGDLDVGPWINWQGQRRLYDPLERNDFWLEEEHE
ncbi:MAG: membrane protein insertion efficiency factor YidD [Mariprofundaceae bacterium]|nr:membrane protein insertion efficiency factor YidD [Mariprofundaceae bacterium]